MKRGPFKTLCQILRTHGLVNGRSVKVKEQVAMFLLIVGHDNRNRRANFEFIRSGETVSRYFHAVVRALISMYKDVVKPARTNNSPRDKGTNPLNWYHYFEDAVGALDGTHFPTIVPIKEQPKYRNRYGKFLSLNVLLACTFDMKLTYVLSGWEGSAHDGRILRDAVRPTRVDKLTVPSEMEKLSESVKEVTKGQLRWYDQMDKIMIDILLEEYGFGQNSKNTWKPKVYTRICVEIQKRLAQKVTPANIKGRLKTLRANYQAARIVLSQSGFGWDPNTKLVTTDELTWNDYLQKHPEHESYRRKRVLFYDELSVIFGDDQATGGNAMTGNEEDIEIPSLEEMSNGEREDKNHSASSATRSTSNGHRIKKKKTNEVDSTEQGLVAAANRLADAFSLTDCARLQTELHNISGLSREDVIRAMLYLGNEAKDANIFFHLDEDLKKDWIIMYLANKF